jgi:hypothetical protein
MKNKKERREQSVSRRNFLRSTGLITSGLCLSGLSSPISPGEAGRHGPEADPDEGVSGSRVRDHLWIFACPVGTDDKSLEKANIRGGSRMTPAEGAFWLGVPNLLLIRVDDLPPLPESEIGRTVSGFEQYAISFQPLDRVIWSICGSSGKGGLNELPYVLKMAKDYPNFSGVYLDDFIIDVRKQPDGIRKGRPALSPDELRTLREKLKITGRPMEIWVTLYTELLLPDHPRAFGCDPPLPEFIGLFDVLTLWTWNSDDLRTLEKSLAALEAVAPQKARIALGIYIWDFYNRKPVPPDLMELQCELGLKWMKEKRISEMIFLANTVFDIGAPGAGYAREWIARNGNKKL